MTKSFHELADIFPLLNGRAYDNLVTDIRKYGLREPIVLHTDGSILDGRNRERACAAAGVSPRYVAWDGAGDAVSFVISRNVHRRHLNESQRAMIAARLCNIGHGGDRKSIKTPIDTLKKNAAASMLKVSEASISRARRVQRDGSSQIIQAVERGELRVAAADNMTRQNKARGETSPGKSAGKRSSGPTGRRRQHENANMWRKLREALEYLNGMPDAAAVVKIVPAAKRELVSHQLPAVKRWIDHFATEWTRKHEPDNGKQIRPDIDDRLTLMMDTFKKMGVKERDEFMAWTAHHQDPALTLEGDG